MLFYIALAWNEQDPVAQRAADEMMQRFQELSPDWTTVLAAPGLTVSCRIAEGYSRVSEAYCLHGETGVVLGKLFERSYTAGEIPARVVLDHEQSARIIASEGRHLIERYWGQYVAFLKDVRSRATWVLRDPTGEIDCFVTHMRGIDVYFLRLQDLERLTALRMTINQQALIGRCVLPIACTRATAINEITAVLAGECVEIRDGRRATEFYWNPLEVASTDLVEDPEEAVRLTREAVRACVHAWASCFDVILHRLSGGLDSAIVLACLRDAPNHPQVVCENLYGRAGSEWDERLYARAAARHAGCELIETPTRGEDYFEVRQALPPAPEPYYCDPLEGNMSRIASLMQARPKPAMFRGHGGDEVFFRHGRLPTVVDFLHRHGLRRRAWRVALADSAVDHIPMWRIARRGITRGLLRRHWNLRSTLSQRMQRDPRLVDEIIPRHLREEVFRNDRIWHPLYVDDIVDVPPGKAYQCYLMSVAAEVRAYAPAQDEPILPLEVSPLCSQPLVELSLRTPLYVLRTGGRDRAIARRAFQGDVPVEILDRRSKGGGNELVRAALRRNIVAIRDFLMNGRLVQMGYLDRSKLAEALALDVPTHLQTSPTFIVRHFMNEVWLQQWPEGALNFR